MKMIFLSRMIIVLVFFITSLPVLTAGESSLFLKGQGTKLTAGPPAVTTDSVTNILSTSAKAWGNVTSDGGSAVTERGFVYSTSENPTISNGLKVVAGTGTGIFTFTVTSLVVTQLYHFRTYAINLLGISYGADKTFSTLNYLIDIQIEGRGTIRKTSGEANTYAAMVWNGKEWVVNNTWAHKYFLDVRTGLRLKTSEIINVSTEADKETYILNYKVNTKSYTYSHAAKNGGSYTYTGVKYTVRDKTTNKQIGLNSRGTGNGTGRAYFDIYIENEDTVGKPQTITAIRNDPKWFIFTGITLDQAMALTDTVQNLTGDFPTIKGWYFMDIGGGGDMGPAGVGKSFIFNTDTIRNDRKTADIASSYPTDFAIRYMDSSGNLHELRFAPKLITEIYNPPVFAPSVTTDSITNILAPSAKVWGKVTSDGGTPVTERGFVYSVTSTPTIEAGTKVTAGSGTGTYNASLINLTYDQLYHPCLCHQYGRDLLWD